MGIDNSMHLEKKWHQQGFKVLLNPRRIINKLLCVLSRQALVHPRIRALLISCMGVNFEDRKDVFIGRDVYFDELNPELISVGRNVYFTEGVRIITHFYDKTKPPHHHRIGRVIIENDVFLGMNVVIADSVRIGGYSVIGANSVVTKDIPPNTIAAGVPCRTVGERKFEKFPEPV